MKYKTAISAVLASVLLSSSFLMPARAAYAVQSVQYSVESSSIETRSVTLGSAAIFFGGMLVGWAVDGTIEYVTGKPPSAWVSVGLKQIERYILNQYRNGKKKIYVPQNGAFTCPGVVIDHSGLCKP